jgi:hypothetical protein
MMSDNYFVLGGVKFFVNKSQKGKCIYRLKYLSLRNTHEYTRKKRVFWLLVVLSFYESRLYHFMSKVTVFMLIIAHFIADISTEFGCIIAEDVREGV